MLYNGTLDIWLKALITAIPFLTLLYFRFLIPLVQSGGSGSVYCSCNYSVNITHLPSSSNAANVFHYKPQSPPSRGL
ncbi:hypothetical protein BDV18DRAFT_139216 [Aspergillus unguis]